MTTASPGRVLVARVYFNPYGSPGSASPPKSFVSRCLDLTDIAFTDVLAASYRSIELAYESEGKALPANAGAGVDAPKRELDCLVTNSWRSDLTCMSEPVPGAREQFARARSRQPFSGVRRAATPQRWR